MYVGKNVTFRWCSTRRLPRAIPPAPNERRRLLAQFTYDHGADWPLDWRVNAVGEGAALTDIAFEPVSSNRSFRCGKRDFQARDKEAETAQDCDRGRRRGCGKLLKRKQTVIEWGSFHMGLKRARQYDASKGG
jgi:hypothetical protein